MAAPHAPLGIGVPAGGASTQLSELTSSSSSPFSNASRSQVSEVSEVSDVGHGKQFLVAVAVGSSAPRGERKRFGPPPAEHRLLDRDDDRPGQQGMRIVAVWESTDAKRSIRLRLLPKFNLFSGHHIWERSRHHVVATTIPLPCGRGWTTYPQGPSSRPRGRRQGVHLWPQHSRPIGNPPSPGSPNSFSNTCPGSGPMPSTPCGTSTAGIPAPI